VLNVIVPIAYAAAAVTYLRIFLREHAPFSRAARAGLILVLSLSVALTLVRMIGEKHVPLSNLGEAFSFFAVCTLAVYALLEVQLRTQKLGVFILVVLVIFQTAASLQFEPFAPIAPDLQSGWFAVHATTSILSFSGFSIAAVMSVLYLLLYRELHGGRPGFIFRRIPSLEALDEMAHRAVAIGFVLLTIGIVTGSLWAHGLWGRYWSWDPKECSAFTIWLVYGAYLWARARRRWAGKRVAYFAVVGFALLIFTFVLDRLIETSHRFV